MKEIEYYVVFRQVAFPELSYDTIIDEWCSQYGAAAETVKAYHARIQKRGDAARAKVAARMKAEMSDVLDDSELSGTVAEAHTLEDFKGDLELLESVDVSKLSSIESKRFSELVAAAKGYIDVYLEVVKESKEAVLRARKWEEEKRRIGAVGTGAAKN